MQYIVELIPIMPMVVMITTLIYFLLYQSLGRKHETPSYLKFLAEFLLIGWLIVFIYVTQLMPFGNGVGDLYNLKPLRQFYMTLKFGSNNARLVGQFFLNILMFVPLGILMPMIFPKRFRKWGPIFLISLGMTLTTEFLQLFSKRGADIDDVIANTLGGLSGFAIFLILYGILYRTKKHLNEIEYYRIKLLMGVGILSIILSMSIIVSGNQGHMIWCK